MFWEWNLSDLQKLRDLCLYWSPFREEWESVCNWSLFISSPTTDDFINNEIDRFFWKLKLLGDHVTCDPNWKWQWNLSLKDTLECLPSKTLPYSGQFNSQSYTLCMHLESENFQGMSQHNRILQVNHNYNEVNMRFFINLE